MTDQKRFEPKGSRPNIILVMSDDQGWGDAGYNGNTILKTPSLDVLAAEGVRFAEVAREFTEQIKSLGPSNIIQAA